MAKRKDSDIDSIDTLSLRRQIIVAGEKAVQELIKVAEERIITQDEKDVAADKLKNAAMSKKLAINDAFEILARIDEEREKLKDPAQSSTTPADNGRQGFAEARSK